MNLRTLQQKLEERFGPGEPAIAVRAPGRVNLLGEHTDYNLGYVFPAAIDRYLHVAARRTKDRRVRVWSENKEEMLEFSLDAPGVPTERRWVNYSRGVCELLGERFAYPCGMDLWISSDIPTGAGLSSSAAIEVGTGYAVLQLFGWEMSRRDLALVCQKAEHVYAQVKCGIMDQFAVALCEPASALLLDCRSLETVSVPLPAEQMTLVILDSNVPRGLVDSEYNQRRQQSEAAAQMAAQLLGRTASSLRDIELDEWRIVEDELPRLIAKRGRHVLSENHRVLWAVELLRSGDLTRFGQVLYEGHASLQHDYEVSCPELDVLVELTKDQPGCYGARMTGAGFGGCTVNVLRPDAVEEFCAKVPAAYEQRTGRKAGVHVCRPVGGVERI